jgi:molybdate transport system regulatory protein
MKPEMTSDRSRTLRLNGHLWLDRKGRSFLGGYRIDLLESIDRMGTLTHAAKAVGLSYKAAWDAVDTMNNLAERPLVIRAAGGQNGGGSYLTDHGRQSVRLYRLLEVGYRRLLARMQAEIHDFDRLNDLLRAIAVRTSARNELRGTVRTVRRGTVNADVILDVGDGVEIFASITNESVEELGLAPGREAFALIKSSFIVLAADENLRISARNRLCGTVTEVITGAVNCEVKIQLPGGRTLTAVITTDGLKDLDLVEGSRCCAMVKASHILIAVND